MTCATTGTVFADLARRLQAETSSKKMQYRITEAAVDTITGCDHAAITIVRRRGGVYTVAATDEVPQHVDNLQYETGQGPCLDAIAEHLTYLIDDLETDMRWPAFSSRAARATGVRSMLSFRLFVQDDTIGALNMYSRRVAAFDEQSWAIGSVLAAHAALALSAASEHTRADELAEALTSNREIGIAIGVLMARGNLTKDEAFVLLRRASQRRNRKLREIATHVVDTGELPS